MLWNASLIVTVGLLITVLGYGRRWIADDALIIVRTVREVLAGNGPVYSPGERAEASTSALWQWLLVALSGISGQDAALIAVYGSLVLTAAGFTLAAASAIRFRRSVGVSTSACYLPLGLILLLALPPTWDFATSGLETGLEYTWIGVAWWLLISAQHGSRARRDVMVAVLISLGPLVRPEQAITTGCFLLAYVVKTHASWRRMLGIGASAAALPLAYEVFRMGYYGVLVPLPGIAKEASLGDPRRGWNYVQDFMNFYWLWLPMAVMTIVLIAVGQRLKRRDAIVFAAPPLAGLLLTAYVVRVGGDYMHARMMLPAMFLFLLPIAMVPISRLTVATTLLELTAAALILSPLRTPFEHGSFNGTTNIRGDSIHFSRERYPLTARDWLHGFPDVVARVAAAQGKLVFAPDYLKDHSTSVPLGPQTGVKAANLEGFLGFTGAAVPLNGRVVDAWSLAYPLTAHLHLQTRVWPGHEKHADPTWAFADYAAPGTVPFGVDPRREVAARHTLTCGAVRELQESVRAPMTWHRFWTNMIGAPERTALRIPLDPLVAEKQFCGR